jgi:hypothetical protein
MEFMLVRFTERRKVLVDGVHHGFTDQVISIEPGPHKVALDPSEGAQPRFQVVVVTATSPNVPCVVDFQRTGA